ncbi:hypothetical protein [Thalassotalea sp. Y01]|uniref:hypothetical protein n=1 Tax=Thalassotalea sp. Y01 TaxID=2729613 RepID=UPI00145C857C|nr:hypothetical protein [Thalassotalea sp. Y01]NMP16181.1 glycosyltransferase family 4 protein [Thalassotalea sp. Y01]
MKPQCKRVLIFGNGRLIEQWRQMTKDVEQIKYCSNYDELAQYPVKDSAVLFAKVDLLLGIKLALRFKLKGYPKVMRRWMGTDVLNLKKLSAWQRLWALPILKTTLDCNLVSASWLGDDLHNMGFKNINSWEAPSPLYYQCLQLTEQHIKHRWQQKPKTIIIYSNEHREWLYKTQQMIELAEKLPEYQFIFVGHPDKQLGQSHNVKSIGIVDQEQMHELYSQGHFLIRITSHDGYSRMVVEAQQYGLQVISNYPRVHGHFAKSNEQIIDVLDSINGANPDARRYALDQFTPEKWTQTLLTQLAAS